MEKSGEFREKSSIRDFSFKLTLVFSRKLTEHIGNGSLVIELDTNLGEDVALTEWIEYSEGAKYFLGEQINLDWNTTNGMPSPR